MHLGTRSSTSVQLDRYAEREERLGTEEPDHSHRRETESLGPNYDVTRTHHNPRYAETVQNARAQVGSTVDVYMAVQAPSTALDNL